MSATPYLDGSDEPRKLFGREPTLWIAAINVLVVIVGTLGFGFITGVQAGLIVAIINAGFAVWNAALVRPVAPAAFSGFIAALVALLAAYGFNLPSETVAAINVAVVPLLALVFRGQVEPKDTRVSKA